MSANFTASAIEQGSGGNEITLTKEDGGSIVIPIVTGLVIKRVLPPGLAFFNHNTRYVGPVAAANTFAQQLANCDLFTVVVAEDQSVTYTA